jgi:hypothetical protein
MKYTEIKCIKMKYVYKMKYTEMKMHKNEICKNTMECVKNNMKEN